VLDVGLAPRRAAGFARQGPALLPDLLKPEQSKNVIYTGQESTQPIHRRPRTGQQTKRATTFYPLGRHIWPDSNKIARKPPPTRGPYVGGKGVGEEYFPSGNPVNSVINKIQATRPDVITHIVGGRSASTSSEGPGIDMSKKAR